MTPEAQEEVWWESGDWVNTGGASLVTESFRPAQRG